MSEPSAPVRANALFVTALLAAIVATAAIAADFAFQPAREGAPWFEHPGIRAAFAAIVAAVAAGAAMALRWALGAPPDADAENSDDPA